MSQPDISHASCVHLPEPWKLRSFVWLVQPLVEILRVSILNSVTSVSKLAVFTEIRPELPDRITVQRRATCWFDAFPRVTLLVSLIYVVFAE